MLALREVMAAGSRFISCLPSMCSALLVPRPSGSAHGYLSFQSNRFLLVGVYTHCGGRILSGFPQISALEENTPGQNMRFHQRVIIFPQNRGLHSRDGGLLITTPLIYSSAQEKRFGVGGLDYQDLSNLCHCLVISPLLI